MSRQGYIVSLEGLEKIKASGIREKILKAKKDYEIDSHGSASEREVIEAARRVARGGLYSKLSDVERDGLMSGLGLAFKDRGTRTWNIQRSDGNSTEPIDLTDFLIMTGSYATAIISAEEVASYSRLGFNSPLDFLGSVSAAIYTELGNYDLDNGFTWSSIGEKNGQFKNSIGGSGHCDLRISRKDITPYPTIDPLGNPVHYRPMGDKDSNYVAAYHSTEPALLVGILRYIEETKLDSRVLADRAKSAIEEARKLKGIITCAEHLSLDLDSYDLRSSFVGFGHPLRTQDIQGETLRGPLSALATGQEGAYRLYIGANGDLVFALYDFRGKETDITPTLRFSSSDIDPLLANLFKQAAARQGRTSLKELEELIGHRYSEQFAADRAQERKRR